MVARDSRNTRDLVLASLHLAFAVLLLALSLLLHGRLPGFSADESAALGFLLFFGLGLPMLLVAITVCTVSVFSGGRYLGILSVAMIAGFVSAVVDMWAGLAASLAYLFLAAWTLAKKLGRPARPVPDDQRYSA